MTKFQASIDQHKNKDRIQQDSSVGNTIGASGTPTFFINGQMVVGAQPFENFKGVIDAQLVNAGILIKKGHPVNSLFYKAAVDENLKIAKVNAPPPPPSAYQVPVRDDDPAKGPEFAKVTIVEFSDFQCPYCSRAVPTVKQVESAYGDSVKVVWKH